MMGRVRRMFENSILLASYNNDNNKGFVRMIYHTKSLNVIFQYTFHCHYITFCSPLPGDGLVEVHNVARNSKGEFTEITGTAYVKEPGVLFVEFAGCKYALLVSSCYFFFTLFSLVFHFHRCVYIIHIFILSSLIFSCSSKCFNCFSHTIAD